MTHSIQEITAKINALTEPMLQEVLDFIDFMQAKSCSPIIVVGQTRAGIIKRTSISGRLGSA